MSWPIKNRVKVCLCVAGRIKVCWGLSSDLDEYSLLVIIRTGYIDSLWVWCGSSPKIKEYSERPQKERLKCFIESYTMIMAIILFYVSLCMFLDRGDILPYFLWSPNILWPKYSKNLTSSGLAVQERHSLVTEHKTCQEKYIVITLALQ
jgi:hypothetical protein